VRLTPRISSKARLNEEEATLDTYYKYPRVVSYIRLFDAVT
jgi:hypothetical protein